MGNNCTAYSKPVGCGIKLLTVTQIFSFSRGPKTTQEVSTDRSPSWCSEGGTWLAAPLWSLLCAFFLKPEAELWLLHRASQQSLLGVGMLYKNLAAASSERGHLYAICYQLTLKSHFNSVGYPKRLKQNISNNKNGHIGSLPSMEAQGRNIKVSTKEKHSRSVFIEPRNSCCCKGI